MAPQEGSSKAAGSRRRTVTGRAVATLGGVLLAVNSGLSRSRAMAMLPEVQAPQPPPGVIRRRSGLLQVAAGGLGLAGADRALAEEAKLKSNWAATDGVAFLTRFSEDSYGAMRDDTRRTPQFIKAIRQRVSARPGLTVLDIGTGPFALFALVAARAGAKKVYAIEANPEAAARAKAIVAKADDIPEGTVEVLEGFTTAITLPEKVDLVLAEIVGAIASEENLCNTIRDCQVRHMKEPGNPENYIPASVQTFAAPVSFALHPVLAPPRFEKLQGQPLRLPPRDRTLQLISDPQIIEELSFADPKLPGVGKFTSKPFDFAVQAERIEANYKEFYAALLKEKVTPEEAEPLATSTAKSFSGMAFWPKLFLDTAGEIVVESRGKKGEHQKSHWQTLMSLMSPTPVAVDAGDIIRLTETAEFAVDILQPARYTLEAKIIPAAKV